MKARALGLLGVGAIAVLVVLGAARAAQANPMRPAAPSTPTTAAPNAGAPQLFSEVAAAERAKQEGSARLALTGGIMFILAAVAPFALMKIIPFAEGIDALEGGTRFFSQKPMAALGLTSTGLNVSNSVKGFGGAGAAARSAAGGAPAGNNPAGNNPGGAPPGGGAGGGGAAPGGAPGGGAPGGGAPGGGAPGGGGIRPASHKPIPT